MEVNNFSRRIYLCMDIRKIFGIYPVEILIKYRQFTFYFLQTSR